jgi:hypothetical protein
VNHASRSCESNGAAAFDINDPLFCHATTVLAVICQHQQGAQHFAKYGHTSVQTASALQFIPSDEIQIECRIVQCISVLQHALLYACNDVVLHLRSEVIQLLQWSTVQIREMVPEDSDSGFEHFPNILPLVAFISEATIASDIFRQSILMVADITVLFRALAKFLVHPHIPVVLYAVSALLRIVRHSHMQDRVLDSGNVLQMLRLLLRIAVVDKAATNANQHFAVCLLHVLIDTSDVSLALQSSNPETLAELRNTAGLFIDRVLAPPDISTATYWTRTNDIRFLVRFCAFEASRNSILAEMLKHNRLAEILQLLVVPNATEPYIPLYIAQLIIAVDSLDNINRSKLENNAPDENDSGIGFDDGAEFNELTASFDSQIQYDSKHDQPSSPKRRGGTEASKRQSRLGRIRSKYAPLQLVEVYAQPPDDAKSTVSAISAASSEAPTSVPSFASVPQQSVQQQKQLWAQALCAPGVAARLIDLLQSELPSYKPGSGTQYARLLAHFVGHLPQIRHQFLQCIPVRTLSAAIERHLLQDDGPRALSLLALVLCLYRHVPAHLHARTQQDNDVVAYVALLTTDESWLPCVADSIAPPATNAVQQSHQANPHFAQLAETISHDDHVYNLKDLFAVLGSLAPEHSIDRDTAQPATTTSRIVTPTTHVMPTQFGQDDSFDEFITPPDSPVLFEDDDMEYHMHSNQAPIDEMQSPLQHSQQYRSQTVISGAARWVAWDRLISRIANSIHSVSTAQHHQLQQKDRLYATLSKQYEETLLENADLHETYGRLQIAVRRLDQESSNAMEQHAELQKRFTSVDTELRDAHQARYKQDEELRNALRTIERQTAELVSIRETKQNQEAQLQHKLDQALDLNSRLAERTEQKEQRCIDLQQELATLRSQLADVKQHCDHAVRENAVLSPKVNLLQQQLKQQQSEFDLREEALESKLQQRDTDAREATQQLANEREKHDRTLNQLNEAREQMAAHIHMASDLREQSVALEAQVRSLADHVSKKDSVIEKHCSTIAEQRAQIQHLRKSFQMVRQITMSAAVVSTESEDSENVSLADNQ